MLAPIEVERKYSDLEEKLIEFLSKSKFPGVYLSTFFLAFLLWTMDWQMVAHPQIFEGTIGQLIPMRLAFVVLPFFAFLGFWIADRHRNLFSFFLVCLFWAVSMVGLSEIFVSGVARWSQFLSVPFLILLSWFYLTRPRPVKQSQTVSYAILFFIIFLGTLLVSAGDLNTYRKVALGIHFHLINLFFFSVTAVGRKKEVVPGDLALNPVHAFLGVLWPVSTKALSARDKQRVKNWWRGAINILVAVAIVHLSFYILSLRPVRVNYKTNYISGLLAFAFYFLSMAHHNLIQGFCRLLGYQVPDRTSFCLLSRTPGEIWQRSNIYKYGFIIEFVYLPLLRRLRLPQVASFIAFMFFFLSQFGILGLVYPLFQMNGTKFPENLVSWRFYASVFNFFFWYSAIVYSRLWWPLRPRENASPVREWMSITLTFVLYYIISMAVFLCSDALSG